MKFRRSLNIRLQPPKEEEIPMILGLSEGSILLTMHELKIKKDKHKP